MATWDDGRVPTGECRTQSAADSDEPAPAPSLSLLPVLHAGAGPTPVIVHAEAAPTAFVLHGGEHEVRAGTARIRSVEYNILCRTNRYQWTLQRIP
jgi:hypothetical protein